MDAGLIQQNTMNHLIRVKIPKLRLLFTMLNYVNLNPLHLSNFYTNMRQKNLDEFSKVVEPCLSLIKCQEFDP